MERAWIETRLNIERRKNRILNVSEDIDITLDRVKDTFQIERVEACIR